MLGKNHLNFADDADVDRFVTMLAKFESGEISSDEWRAFRLVHGAYGQREAGADGKPQDANMLRVKIPQGVLGGPQLRALAEVAERHSRGFGHITTRQNVQFHFMRMASMEPAMRSLAEAGLTTREACGNSVRTITACPYAGVAADEPFDVTPYAQALTHYLLRHPLSSTLPRKFKIAFEGCQQDHAFTAIHDIGFWAQRRSVNGALERGFKVTVGGGTAIFCRSGQVLCDFVPVAGILDIAEAVMRVFHRLGDREHRKRNRMKFLLNSLGWEAFHAEFTKELEDFRAAGGAVWPAIPEAISETTPPPASGEAADAASLAARVSAGALRGPGLPPRVLPILQVDSASYAHWQRTNVRPQKQTNFSIVTVALPLGDLTAAQLRVLADLAAAFGDGTVRMTQSQNVVFRWVHSRWLPDLYRRLLAASLATPDADTVADVTSCPGAESCKLAVTQSRGLARTVGDYLREHPDLVRRAPNLKIKISGCPNGCGQHHIADIGFQGGVRKVGKRAVPQYFLMLGGGVSPEGARFGKVVAKIPARRINQAVQRLLDHYASAAQPHESAEAFLRRIEPAAAKQLLADLEPLSQTDANEDDFIDLGEQGQFAPQTEAGECAG